MNIKTIVHLMNKGDCLSEKVDNLTIKTYNVHFKQKQTDYTKSTQIRCKGWKAIQKGKYFIEKVEKSTVKLDR